MSAYHLSPSPDLSSKEQNYATWNDAFSESEVSNIKQIGDGLASDVAGVENNELIEDLRKSKVGWIALNNNTNFIYDKLAYVSRQLNGQFFDFDLYGFVEDFQYTVYNGSGNDHYTWHMDKGNLNSSPRKLSLVMQLSDPSEYEGGDLELWLGGDAPITIEKKKGMIVAFPSFILHRVTPVTRGTRKSLVVWVTGNKFR